MTTTAATAAGPAHEWRRRARRHGAPFAPFRPQKRPSGPAFDPKSAPSRPGPGRPPGGDMLPLLRWSTYCHARRAPRCGRGDMRAAAGRYAPLAPFSALPARGVRKRETPEARAPRPGRANTKRRCCLRGNRHTDDADGSAVACEAGVLQTRPVAILRVASGAELAASARGVYAAAASLPPGLPASTCRTLNLVAA
eukprot:scaffold7846_cov417-Prasinococcus_capsulatus_cf.AAC.7